MNRCRSHIIHPSLKLYGFRCARRRREGAELAVHQHSVVPKTDAIILALQVLNSNGVLLHSPGSAAQPRHPGVNWIPAFAGMTEGEVPAICHSRAGGNPAIPGRCSRLRHARIQVLKCFTALPVRVVQATFHRKTPSFVCRTLTGFVSYSRIVTQGGAAAPLTLGYGM